MWLFYPTLLTCLLARCLYVFLSDVNKWLNVSMWLFLSHAIDIGVKSSNQLSHVHSLSECHSVRPSATGPIQIINLFL